MEFNDESGPVHRLLRDWDFFLLLIDLTDFVPEKVASLETDLLFLDFERLFRFPIDYEKQDLVGVTMRSYAFLRRLVIDRFVSLRGFKEDF